MEEKIPPVFKIVVATHKPYKMPRDKLYQPILVGSSLYFKNHRKTDFGDFFTFDNTGRNISTKNPYYSELCGLYWLWQNFAKNDKSSESYYGLFHYRRFLSMRKTFFAKKTLDNILSFDDFQRIIKKNKKHPAYNIILPKKRHYLIETLYDHYSHTLHIEPLDLTRKIIEQKYPEFLFEFNQLKIRRSAHMFNIFIFKKDLFNQYCEFLFDILFTLEQSFSENELLKFDDFHSRFFGRISELLLDIFLYTTYPSLKEQRFSFLKKQKRGRKNNTESKKASSAITTSKRTSSSIIPSMIELNVLELESVNWMKKILNFLFAKFLGKKYRKSY